MAIRKIITLIYAKTKCERVIISEILNVSKYANLTNLIIHSSVWTQTMLE